MVSVGVVTVGVVDDIGAVTGIVGVVDIVDVDVADVADVEMMLTLLVLLMLVMLAIVRGGAGCRMDGWHVLASAANTHATLASTERYPDQCAACTIVPYCCSQQATPGLWRAETRGSYCNRVCTLSVR